MNNTVPYGLLIEGLPITTKYDKLLDHLTYNKRFRKLWKGCRPLRITLYYEMIDSVRVTTGTALFTFPPTKFLGTLSCSPHIRRANNFLLDKSHKLKASMVIVNNDDCFTVIPLTANIS